MDGGGAAWIRWNLRIAAAVAIAAGVVSWLAGLSEPRTPALGSLPFGVSRRAATLLAGDWAYRGLAVAAALGWWLGRFLPPYGQRMAAFVFGPLVLFPQVVVGCIFVLDEPQMRVPKLAVVLGAYLVFAMTLFAFRPRDEYDTDY